MLRRPPRSTRTDTLFPYTTLFRSFPETQAGAFKALPADVRDTRVMCYTLSTVLLQIFAASEIAPDPRAATYVKMNGQLEHLLNSEVYPAEDDAHMGEIRSEQRRVGKGCVRTCKSRWSPWS